MNLNQLFSIKLLVALFLSASGQEIKLQEGFEPLRLSTKIDDLILTQGIIEDTNNLDSIYINNINATFNCNGTHFWDFSGTSHFLVPKATRQKAIFLNVFQIGGLGTESTLHLAGINHGMEEKDFWPGPVSDVYDSLYDKRWRNVFKISRDEIIFHIHNWWKPEYICPAEILQWPGNGDVSSGQASILAPFYDKNSNGLYEPLLGDYPLIRGDQALFFIFNDDRGQNNEIDARKLGVEVQGMAYAFQEPADSALWNTVFLHYDLINRSDTTYFDTYLCVHTDIDIGNPWDDYTGCDVKRGMYYCYNGDDIDEDYMNGKGYLHYLPSLGVVFLGGPLMDEDGIDNPGGACDESINGLNFGDGVEDNERFGMIRFLNNSTSGVQGTPSTASQLYALFKGFWKDGTPVVYGGNGHISYGGVGPECNFMFPGDTDSCNWGTGGIEPDYGLWTESILENNPGDRRGRGITGPFTFKPGDLQQLDLAFVFARDYTGSGNLSSIEILQQRIDSLRKMAVENLLIELPEMMSVQKIIQDKSNILISPNPVGSEIRFSVGKDYQNAIYRILNIAGMEMKSGELPNVKNHCVKVEKLPKGIYFLVVIKENTQLQSKFIKL